MKYETLTHLFSRATDTSSSRKKTAESSSKRVPSVWWCSGPLDANVSAFISSNSESWRKNLDSENSCSGWHSYTGWESVLLNIKMLTTSDVVLCMLECKLQYSTNLFSGMCSCIWSCIQSQPHNHLNPMYHDRRMNLEFSPLAPLPTFTTNQGINLNLFPYTTLYLWSYNVVPLPSHIWVPLPSHIWVQSSEHVSHSGWGPSPTGRCWPSRSRGSWGGRVCLDGCLLLKERYLPLRVEEVFHLED